MKQALLDWKEVLIFFKRLMAWATTWISLSRSTNIQKTQYFGVQKYKVHPEVQSASRSTNCVQKYKVHPEVFNLKNTMCFVSPEVQKVSRRIFQVQKYKECPEVQKVSKSTKSVQKCSTWKKIVSVQRRGSGQASALPQVSQLQLPASLFGKIRWAII